MQLDHPAAASLLVQAVDVLGHHGESLEPWFEARQRDVRRVRRHRRHAFAAQAVPVPDQRRVALEGLGRRQFLGAHVPPQPLGPAERRQAALDRDAGAAQHRHRFGGRQEARDLAQRVRSHVLPQSAAASWAWAVAAPAARDKARRTADRRVADMRCIFLPRHGGPRYWSRNLSKNANRSGVRVSGTGPVRVADLHHLAGVADRRPTPTVHGRSDRRWPRSSTSRTTSSSAIDRSASVNGRSDIVERVQHVRHLRPVERAEARRRLVPAARGPRGTCRPSSSTCATAPAPTSTSTRAPARGCSAPAPPRPARRSSPRYSVRNSSAIAPYCRRARSVNDCTVTPPCGPHQPAQLPDVGARQNRHVVVPALRDDVADRRRQHVPVHDWREPEARRAAPRHRLRQRLHQLLPGHRAQVGDRRRPLRLGEASARRPRRRSASASRARPRRRRRSTRRSGRWRDGTGPRASGDAMRLCTDIPPADCPAIVTRAGSPPNAAMLSRTHRSAAIWSSSP